MLKNEESSEENQKKLFNKRIEKLNLTVNNRVFNVDSYFIEGFRRLSEKYQQQYVAELQKTLPNTKADILKTGWSNFPLEGIQQPHLTTYAVSNLKFIEDIIANFRQLIIGAKIDIADSTFNNVNNLLRKSNLKKIELTLV